MRRYKSKPFFEYRFIHKTSAGRYIGSVSFTTLKEARATITHFSGGVEIVKVKVTEVC